MAAPLQPRQAGPTPHSHNVANGGDIEIVVQPAGEVSWHAIPDTAEVLKRLGTSLDGLSQAEAAARLQKNGPNRITPPKKAGFFKRLWGQLNNVLIFILLAAAVVVGALQEWAEFGLILGVVAINAAIGMIQEGKAEKAAEALKAMLSSNASVVRGGEKARIPAEELVVGDIVVLKSGDKLPADVRLLEATNLQVQEAMLTGESVPSSKKLQSVEENAPLGDRKCMAYSATNVTSGNAKGVVVATGDNAEIGKINSLVSKVEDGKTNLTRQLEILGRYLAIICFGLALLSFLLALLKENLGFAAAFESAVAIAVAIIPEGLPALVTIVLAIGTTVMARNHAIIRQLPAVETLGSLTVICSDKTGTLTKNEMTVVAIRTAASLFNVTGVGYAPVGSFTTSDGTQLTPDQLPPLRAILEGAVLCNDSALSSGKNAKDVETFTPVGAPTEVALITAGAKAGVSLEGAKAAKPRVGAVPFESEHKFMATVHQDGQRRVIYVKGAADRLLPMCRSQVEGDNLEQTAALNAQFWQDQQAELSAKGLRVLALCRAEVGASEDISGLSAASILARKEPWLSFVAMFAILDPPRTEAIAAIELAHRAGIQVKMITGDHALTALAIGKSLGIAGSGMVLTGTEVDAMDEQRLQQVVMKCNIYARSSPENKIQIVRALQAKRQVVSMTGDGVNDAPALKAADVGVAMGITGTDVSKEAANMVLADDNFASIVAAVREGRRVWDNLRKLLVFNLPVNMAQGTSIMWAYIIGLETPLTAIQVLYVNLVTAVTLGLMLATEPAEPTVMDRPPRRPSKRLLGKLVIWRYFFASTVLVFLVLGMFVWSGQLGYNIEQRRAEAFNVLVFGEIGYAITCRFLKLSTFSLRVFFGNPWCFFAIGVTAGLQVLITYTPGLNSFFSMAGMDGLQWARVLVCMVVVYAVMEIEKALVDPVLMPLIRPVLRWFEDHTPVWLQSSSTKDKVAERAAIAEAASAAGDSNGEQRVTK